MVHRRKEKEELKSVSIEKRVEIVEKQLSRLNVDNLNFLISNIRQMQSTIKSYEFNLTMTRRFMENKKIAEEFDAWFDKEVEALENKKIPAQPPVETPLSPPGGVTNEGKIETVNPNEKKPIEN